MNKIALVAVMLIALGVASPSAKADPTEDEYYRDCIKRDNSNLLKIEIPVALTEANDHFLELGEEEVEKEDLDKYMLTLAEQEKTELREGANEYLRAMLKASNINCDSDEGYFDWIEDLDNNDPDKAQHVRMQPLINLVFLIAEPGPEIFELTAEEGDYTSSFRDPL